MKTLTEKYVAKLGLLTLVGLFSISQAVAQSGEIPRTPSGKPDLSGIWQAMTSAHYDVEPHAAAEGPHPGLMGAHSATPAGLGIVEGGRIPYNEQARRVRDQNKANALENDPLTKCYMPGVPRANYMPFPFQIVQSEGVILVAYEYAESNRIVYVDQPELGGADLLGQVVHLPELLRAARRRGLRPPARAGGVLRALPQRGGHPSGGGRGGVRAQAAGPVPARRG